MKSLIPFFAFLFLGQKLDALRDGALLLENENHKDFLSSASVIPSDASHEFKQRSSSSKWNEELSYASSAITESAQVGEITSASKLPAVRFFSSLNTYFFYHLNSKEYSGTIGLVIAKSNIVEDVPIDADHI